ncbi:MAG: hypothetical protein MZV64_26980 [Ignavibacteriales bacterium]|nr:hypothetical protein [Ignavibacteriales bacterium]
MVNAISGNSNIQTIRALQAFKNVVETAQTQNVKKIEKPQEQGVSVSISTETQNLINGLKIDNTNSRLNEASLTPKKPHHEQIKQYVSKYGINDLTDEDIDYAMRYGRSVLVNKVG